MSVIVLVGAIPISSTDGLSFNKKKLLKNKKKNHKNKVRILNRPKKGRGKNVTTDWENENGKAHKDISLRDWGKIN